MRSYASNNWLRNDSNRKPRSCGAMLEISNSCAFRVLESASVNNFFVSETGFVDADVCNKLSINVGSKSSGILKDNRRSNVLRWSISSRVSGLPLPRRQVNDCLTISIISGVKR